MRFYIAGEYTPVTNGFDLVRQHAVRVGASRTAECGYVFSALDWSMSTSGPHDWQDPRSRVGGSLCQACLDVTDAPA